MTQRDAFDDLADRFGTHLQQAEARIDRARRPLRLRRIALAGGGLAIAGTAAALVIGIGGGGKLDVVQQAEAALAPEGTILHMQIAYGRAGQPDDPKSRELRETWSTTNPTRWRFLEHTPLWRWIHGKGHMTAKNQTIEFAYAGGTLSNYSSSTNQMDITSGYGTTGLFQSPITWTGMPAGQDPVAALRSMLANGRLKSAGKATLYGREILRLKGMSEAQKAPIVPSFPVEFDVDASTFVPVRMTITDEVGAFHGVPAHSIVSVMWFRTFERLPVTPANEALLAIQTPTDAHISRAHLPVKGQPCKRADQYSQLCED